jgi:hypothetical protein
MGGYYTTVCTYPGNRYMMQAAYVGEAELHEQLVMSHAR